MPHSLSCGSRYACNKAHDGFLHMIFYPFGSSLFIASADFADHDNCIRFRIVIKELQYVDVL